MNKHFNVYLFLLVINNSRFKVEPQSEDLKKLELWLTIIEVIIS